MDYYILDEIPGNPDIPYIGDLPEELNMVDAVLGERLSIKEFPIRIPVSAEDESELNYPDILTADIPLFSEKLKQALDELGIKNIDYHPVELFDEETGKAVAQYYMAVVLSLVECLQSGLTRNSVDMPVLNKPVIDSSKIQGLRLFRLGEKPRLIIIDSNIKDSLARANLNGVSLQNLQDYTSTLL